MQTPAYKISPPLWNLISINGSSSGGGGGIGPIGPAGQQGVAAFTGSTGFSIQGPTGYQGITGAIGPAGSTGPTGYGGAIGPTGITGSSGNSGVVVLFVSTNPQILGTGVTGLQYTVVNTAGTNAVLQTSYSGGFVDTNTSSVWNSMTFSQSYKQASLIYDPIYGKWIVANRSLGITFS